MVTTNNGIAIYDGMTFKNSSRLSGLNVKNS